MVTTASGPGCPELELRKQGAGGAFGKARNVWVGPEKCVVLCVDSHNQSKAEKLETE